jgi:hypothetical protein
VIELDEDIYGNAGLLGDPAQRVTDLHRIRIGAEPITSLGRQSAFRLEQR